MLHFQRLLLAALPLLSSTAALDLGLQDTVREVPSDSLRAALEETLAPKYRDGVFEDHEDAIQAVHQADPGLATRLVELAKLHVQQKEALLRRQTNDTAITSSSTSVVVVVDSSTTISSTTVETSVVVVPVTSSTTPVPSSDTPSEFPSILTYSHTHLVWSQALHH